MVKTFSGLAGSNPARSIKICGAEFSPNLVAIFLTVCLSADRIGIE
jgi:hypothetical protein